MGAFFICKERFCKMLVFSLRFFLLAWAYLNFLSDRSNKKQRIGQNYYSDFENNEFYLDNVGGGEELKERLFLTSLFLVNNNFTADINGSLLYQADIEPVLTRLVKEESVKFRLGKRKLMLPGRECSRKRRLSLSLSSLPAQSFPISDEDEDDGYDDRGVKGKERSRSKSLPRVHESSLASTVPPASFCGLKNQGSTCYINSIIQALFHLKDFRKIILSYPVDSAYPFPLALQSLFRDMTKGFVAGIDGNATTSHSASTLALTQALSINPHVDEDISEFLGSLFAKLEDFFNSSSLHASKKQLSDLFASQLRTTISPLVANAFKPSVSNDLFMDIKLQVRDTGSIMNSFNEFLKNEELRGENQYQSGSAYHDAVKSSRFTKLAPILIIHLHRIHFDLQTYRPKKVLPHHYIN